MASIEQYPLDTTQALYNPTSAVLIELETANLSTGLWKIGSCYEDKLSIRPRCAAQYDPVYFDRDRAVRLCYGLVDTAHAALLETACIRHAKFDLMTGVNTKSKDDTPHDGYCAGRPGALYAVPVRSDVATTQEEFTQVHVSYYMQSKPPKKSTHQKRQELLEQLIAAIPMQQLQRAFDQRWTSAWELRKLQPKYGFKESNNTIYSELRVLFDEY